MQVRTTRDCRAPECAGVDPHEDDEGTRFFGIPAWAICFALVVAGAVAMLAYTAVERA